MSKRSSRRAVPEQPSTSVEPAKRAKIVEPELPGLPTAADKQPKGVSVAKKQKPSVAQIFETLEYGPAPESSAVADKWLEDHGRSFGHFINGQWVKPEGKRRKGAWHVG